MGQYLKLFRTEADYEAASDKPDVAHIIEDVSIEYKSGEIDDGRVIAKFNVTDTTTPLILLGTTEWWDKTDLFSDIEIDGVILPNVVNKYTFSTTGLHTVKYTLKTPTKVDQYAFESAEMESVKIPSAITELSFAAFSACTNMVSFEMTDNVTLINQSFGKCSKLSSINLSKGLTRIVSSSFYGCSSLGSIEIPSSITNVEASTFGSCSGLTEVILPSSITAIYNNAFSNCTSLERIVVNAVNPPSLKNTNAFLNTNNCIIYVPSESVSRYKSATNWKTYASRIQAIP